MPQNDPSPAGIATSSVNSILLNSALFTVSPVDVNNWNYQKSITIPANFTSILFILYAINIPSPQPQALRFGIICEFEPDHFTFMHSATVSFPFGPFTNIVCNAGYGPIFLDDNFIPDTANLTGLGTNAPIDGQSNQSYFRNLPLMFPLMATFVARGVGGIRPTIDVNMRWIFLR